MGIDPSSAATGLVVLSETPRQSPVCLLEEEIVDKNLTGVRKQRATCTRIMTAIKVWKPDKIVIEGYSLNLQNKSSIIALVELGGILRFCMVLDGLSWYEVKASQVKQFATGSGNAKKAQVMMHVLKRWGHESKSDNTADAYTLAAIGLASANLLKGMTQTQYGIAMNLTARTN
jgi:Holliday junction resolvasome RuvABC endonuclease subunit